MVEHVRNNPGFLTVYDAKYTPGRRYAYIVTEDYMCDCTDV